MRELKDRVAVITGGASGIGRGIAQACAEAGMKLVLADVDGALLQETTQALCDAGHDATAVVTDVGDQASVDALAARAIALHGRVHLLCNNAGVAGGGGPVWELGLEAWKRIVDVNLMGVIHGVRSFVPGMLAHGEEAHVVNTASIAGLVPTMETSYAVTKAGVVALSEALLLHLQQTGKPVSASVLCPGWVNTAIADNAQKSLGDAMPSDPLRATVFAWVQDQLRAGLDPRDVGDMVLQAVREQRFYILTHPTWTPMVEQRMRRILDGGVPELPMPPGIETLFERIAALGAQS